MQTAKKFRVDALQHHNSSLSEGARGRKALRQTASIGSKPTRPPYGVVERVDFEAGYRVKILGLG